ncbi:MAG: GPR endopeptidase [Oscillospiraceae bacterium]|nr:GPR endopeptidase [Oscillospiraceae bacterium]
MVENTVFSIRTDMADEAHKLWSGTCKDNTDLKGVKSKEIKIHGLDINQIDILDATGEQALGKARGKYFSLTLPELFDRGSEIFSPAVLAISQLLKECGVQNKDNVLVAALGNPDITPDALGNLSASNILVTAHLNKTSFPQFSSLSLCRPGVLGTSGIESAVQVRALKDIVHPDLIIAVDALAGSDAGRLCRCIQISNAGISPGSGVANNRAELSEASLGVSVISIGMPTVMDAACFGAENCRGMFVTPRSIDSKVRHAARLIAYGINLAVHNSLSIDDIDALVG